MSEESENPSARFSPQRFMRGFRSFPLKFRGRLSATREFLKNNLSREKIFLALQQFDPQAALEWASKTLQNRGIAFYGTLVTIILSTYFLADVTALGLGTFIPSPPPAVSRLTSRISGPRTFEEYAPIYVRNLFNSQGLIPGEETGAFANGMDAAPVKTSLPFNLIGIVLMQDERRSIATIEDKGANAVYPVQMEDEVPGKFKILKVEPKRVTFVNFANSRREFLELPEEANAQNPRLTPGKPLGAVGAGVEQVAPTQFNVSRSEVDRALSDLNNILTQARAIPNFENGVPAGYKLFQIVPGSIYDKLGLKNGDVISGLNGSPINDPGKAFEQLAELKTASHLELQVKKENKTYNYIYDIR